jgi:hypothetical protein
VRSSKTLDVLDRVSVLVPAELVSDERHNDEHERERNDPNEYFACSWKAPSIYLWPRHETTKITTRARAFGAITDT